MSYHISKTIKNIAFEKAIEKVTEELKKEGFGVLTEIDVKATLRKKLDVDFKNYTILGACNPPFAYEALKAEDKIGTMLPCNVVLQENKGGNIEVSAVNPLESMKAIENEKLGKIAMDIKQKLINVINAL